MYSWKSGLYILLYQGTAYMDLSSLPLLLLLASPLLLSVQLATCSNIGGTRQDITLSGDGGYGNILIAIDDSVPENSDIIPKLKKYFIAASKSLLTATGEQKYFHNFTIVVPATWNRLSAWETATYEQKLDKARVIVGPANKAWDDTPYTLQPGLCGQEGDYIHLTPYYLSDIAGRAGATPGRRLVREFAHLKWGLFDEDVPKTDTISRRFYGVDGELKPTRCVQDGIFGVNVDPTRDFQRCDEYDTTKQEYGPNCVFRPDSTTSFATASIMYAEYLSSVDTFCTADNHDSEAPNRQNALCNEKSSWEVMSQLDDFVGDSIASRNGNVPTDPIFTIVHPSEMETSTTTTSTTPGPVGVNQTIIQEGTFRECSRDILCLCLDVSGSMDNFNRIDHMAQAVKTYISSFLPDGAAVGIVSFEGSAHLLSEMTEIRDQSDRMTLQSRVPTAALGGTSIGAGLKLCQEILEEYSGGDVSFSRIVLLSDGDQNTNPLIDDVFPAIEQLGITIDSMLYGKSADEDARNIAMITGGSSLFTNDEDSQAELRRFFTETVQRGCSEITIIILENIMVSIPSNETSISRVVPIDRTIGLNTTLVFSYTDDITVEISVEEGNNVVQIKDEDLKLITAIIEGTVIGDVSYTLRKVKPDAQVVEEIVITVTSEPVPGIDPIIINTRLNNADIEFTEDTELVIYVDAFQRLTPVLGLTVIVTIIRNTEDGEPLICTDDGTGKDSTPNDGVYSTVLYAHQFQGDGFYSLTVDVSGEALLPSDIIIRRKRCTDCNSLGNVLRTASGGVVSVMNHFDVTDLTKPEKIKDFTADSISQDNSFIYTFRWTAPGDDLNVGNVSEYRVFVSKDSTVTNFRQLPNDHESILTDLDSLLLEAGTTLYLQIDTGKISNSFLGVDDSDEIKTFYFRLATVDDEGNVAEFSNPATATLITKIDIISATSTEIPEAAAPDVISLTMGIIGGIAAVALTAGITTAVCICKSKRRFVKRDAEQDDIHRRMHYAGNRSSQPAYIYSNDAYVYSK